MKTHDQRKANDCMRCCVATVLGFDYEEVPDFTGADDYDQRRHLAGWCSSMRCYLVALQATSGSEMVSPLFHSPSSLWIAGGPSARGAKHAVVYEGAKMVHDPHPSRGGLTAITDAFVIVGTPTHDHGLSKELIHEAGHAVVADALGLRVVLIEPTDDGYRTGFEVSETPTRDEHFMIAVATAGGPIAQELALLGQDRGCIQDVNEGVGSLLVYLGYDPTAPPEEEPESLNAALRKASALAADILTPRWATVIALAKALQEHTRLEDEFLADFFERANK